MTKQNEQPHKILKMLLTGWVVILCLAMVLLFPVFPIRFIVGNTAAAVFLLLSFVLSILSFLKKRCIFLGIASLILGCFIFSIGKFTNTFTPIYNPFSAQQFAVEFNINPFQTTGTVTYYRRWGPFLYDPKQTESGQVTVDPNYVSVAQNSIYVNATFMGYGESFDEHNSFIDLRQSSVEEWYLKHESYTWIESFALTNTSPYILTYRTSGDAREKCYLTDEQYSSLRKMLEAMPLADEKETTDKDAFSYYLEVSIKDDEANYRAVVDGEKVFALMQQYIKEKGTLPASVN